MRPAASAKHHSPRLVHRREARAAVHGMHPIGKLNAWVATRITTGVGSMYCAYAFAALALISLPAAISSRNPIIIIGWIAQTFLQLVLLPIIIVGQNIQAVASDQRAEADHDTLVALHTLTATVHTINMAQTVILRMLAKQATTGDKP